MLDIKDTERVKRWLEERFTERARKSGDARGLLKELATYVGTTPQAVSGWKRTGRITKTNLAKAARFFDHQPDFLLSTPDGGLIVAELKPPPYRSAPKDWPFDDIDYHRLVKLDTKDLIRLEGAMLATASQLGLEIRKRRAA